MNVAPSNSGIEKEVITLVFNKAKSSSVKVEVLARPTNSRNSGSCACLICSLRIITSLNRYQIIWPLVSSSFLSLGFLHNDGPLTGENWKKSPMKIVTVSPIGTTLWSEGLDYGELAEGLMSWCMLCR